MSWRDCVEREQQTNKDTCIKEGQIRQGVRNNSQWMSRACVADTQTLLSDDAAISTSAWRVCCIAWQMSGSKHSNESFLDQDQTREKRKRNTMVKKGSGDMHEHAREHASFPWKRVFGPFPHFDACAQ